MSDDNAGKIGGGRPQGGISHMLRSMSAIEFRALGSGHIAYLKPVMVESRQVFALYGADGRFLGLQDDLEQVILAARSSGLEPVVLQ